MRRPWAAEHRLGQIDPQRIYDVIEASAAFGVATPRLEGKIYQIKLPGARRYAPKVHAWPV